MLTFAAFGDGSAQGTFGRTSPLMQMRIVDTDDNEVPAGEVGEIVCRGPLVMRGYWNRPDETVRRFRNGWHHTNDLGRREPDGSLTFIGPKARMIKSAAENIYPAEVENCIRLHPAIAACAVIGIPDPAWSQQVVAIVVLRDGASANADDIIEHCRARIASYKKPRRVEFVDALPADPDAAFGGGGYPGTA
jgi:long-chain acyl-CoA synthetase